LLLKLAAILNRVYYVPLQNIVRRPFNHNRGTSRVCAAGLQSSQIESHGGSSIIIEEGSLHSIERKSQKRGEEKQNEERVMVPLAPTWIASVIRELGGGLEVGFLYIVTED
jgi:hypothetical protein